MLILEKQLEISHDTLVEVVDVVRHEVVEQRDLVDRVHLFPEEAIVDDRDRCHAGEYLEDFELLLPRHLEVGRFVDEHVPDYLVAAILQGEQEYVTLVPRIG